MGYNIENVSNFLLPETMNDTLGAWMYYTIGTVLICVLIIGFVTNLAVIYTFAANKQIRTTDTCLIMGLALIDIGQPIFGIPFAIVSSFQQQWIFGMRLCQFYAFITTTLGIAQITALTSIATERYFIIVHHKRKLSSTINRCAIVIGFSFLHGCVWATGPLLGWSKYKLEETEIACCVTWEANDTLSISYTISICTFGWFIPLLILMYAYMCIAGKIYTMNDEMQHFRRQNSNASNRYRERKVAVTVLIMIGAFVISWMPYSVVSLWSALGDFNSIPLGLQVAPAIFAKCSIIWNPIIYVARHKKFRKGVLKSLPKYIFRKKFANTCDGNLETLKRSSNDKKQNVLQHVDVVVNVSVASDGNVQGHSPALTLMTLPSYAALSKRKLFQQKSACHVEGDSFDERSIDDFN